VTNAVFVHLPMTLAAGAMTLAAGAMALAAAAATTAGAQDILLNRAPDREQTIVDGARKEAQVVLYSAMIVNQALRPLTDAFMKKYPFVKMTFWRGDTEEIVDKLSAEERAHNVVADVVEGTGVGDLAVNAGLTQPYDTPLVATMPERYRDPRGRWTYTRISYFSIAYNTRLVPPDQAPKSYDALLDPRWQSKLAWRVGTASGAPLFITAIRLSRGEDKAAAYLRKLAAQKMINFGSGSARTLVDELGRRAALDHHRVVEAAEPPQHGRGAHLRRPGIWARGARQVLPHTHAYLCAHRPQRRRPGGRSGQAPAEPRLHQDIRAERRRGGR